MEICNKMEDGTGKEFNLLNKSKYEEFSSTEDVKSRVKHAVLTVGEYEDAFRDLFLATQEGITFQDSTLNRLTVFRDEDTVLWKGSKSLIKKKWQYLFYHM